jgi:hypothetical protein
MIQETLDLPIGVTDVVRGETTASHELGIERLEIPGVSLLVGIGEDEVEGTFELLHELVGIPQPGVYEAPRLRSMLYSFKGPFIPTLAPSPWLQVVGCRVQSSPVFLVAALLSLLCPGRFVRPAETGSHAGAWEPPQDLKTQSPSH